MTGDRVSVSNPGAPASAGFSATPAPGREGVAFWAHRRAGHLVVIPSDALGLVTAGVLDLRLFDVTLLVELGYDDAHRATTPLIVRHAAAPLQRTPAILGATAGGGAVKRDLRAIGATAIDAPRDELDRPWTQLVRSAGTSGGQLAGGIDHIWLDGRRAPSLDVSVPAIGAPTAWAAGMDGTGVGVAVVDTGIDASHPDLAGKVAAEANFTSDPDDRDLVGHGTHVASTIAGTGAASGGTYRGVAPGASLIDAKVCATLGCDESAILAGMQWAAVDQHARVVNMSLSGADMEGLDPVEDAVGQLSAAYGTLFVVAAGNDGPSEGTVGSPGSADAALTVGAVDSADQIADFSGRGPRVGDDALKPDVVAPGVGIVAAASSTGKIGEPVSAGYVRLSGTSMATPHVAGAAALVAQAHAGWSGPELKAAVMGSALPTAASGYEEGAGRVDAARAISQVVTSSPTSVSFGRALWPHGDDPVSSASVTYRNTGSTDVTLHVATEIDGPDGSTPPPGMVTVTPEDVTVPAGGAASVTVTMDTNLGAADGLWSGQMIATGGGVRVSTPVGINQEVESYELLVQHLDWAGKATDQYGGLVANVDTGAIYDLYRPSGTARLRLPPGTYDLVSTVYGPNADGVDTTALFSLPSIHMTSAKAITVDLRQSAPVDLRPPGETGELRTIQVGYSHHPGLASTLFATVPGSVYSAALGEPVDPATYTAHVHAEWYRPGPAGSDGSSYFGLAAFQEGSLFTGYQRTWRPEELATIQEQYLAVGASAAGGTITVPSAPGDDFISVDAFAVDLPSNRTDHLSTEPGTTWYRALGVDGLQLADRTTVTAGEVRTDRWGEAAFAPSVPDLGGAYVPYVSRIGDDLDVRLQLAGDPAGHAGGSLRDTGSTVVYASDGSLVGSSDYPGSAYVTLPEPTDTYRLVVQGTRAHLGDLSTAFALEWSFLSAHTHGPAQPASVVPSHDPDQSGSGAVPLFVVRPVARTAGGALPPDPEWVIPLEIQYQPGATPAALRSLRVDASSDGGQTWLPAAVACPSGACSARVPWMAGPGHLSLRIEAADVDGTSVKETLVDAYRISDAPMTTTTVAPTTAVPTTVAPTSSVASTSIVAPTSTDAGNGAALAAAGDSTHANSTTTTGTLPVTGAAVGSLVAIGVVLLLMGAVAVRQSSRRTRSVLEPAPRGGPDRPSA